MDRWHHLTLLRTGWWSNVVLPCLKVRSYSSNRGRCGRSILFSQKGSSNGVILPQSCETPQHTHVKYLLTPKEYNVPFNCSARDMCMPSSPSPRSRPPGGAANRPGPPWCRGELVRHADGGKWPCASTRRTRRACSLRTTS